MKIIVTGSRGFIGSHLVKYLKQSIYDMNEVDISQGRDITNFKSISDLPDFNVLIHLAAKVFVPDSYSNPRGFFYTNITGTLNALELCRRNNAKMIFLSAYVYGTPDYIPIDETHPVKSFNPYASSKIISEQLCTEYHKQFGVNVIILRPFNIYGSGQDSNFLIPSILQQANKGEVILKDSRPRRDMLYIDDLIDAILRVIKYEDTSFEIINLGMGQSLSIKEMVEIIMNTYIIPFSIKFTGEHRPNEVLDTIADISKAKRLLDWQPKVSFREGISKMLNI